MATPRHILPVIVIAQFCCTSLWFAGNAVMSDLTSHFDLADGALGAITSSVQFGFIVGTLVFAILSVADRYPPSRLFMVCAVAGALSNYCITWESGTYATILVLRFCTGFFLAGIYPVGMKIAADYYDSGLGKSLGYLVGALVLGTAFPHMLQVLRGDLDWQLVLVATSVLTLVGGSIMTALVPDGPYRQPRQQFSFSTIPKIFRDTDFCGAALGYFGHMWELYSFWAFVPVLLAGYNALHGESVFDVPLVSFAVIAVGSLACILSGYLAQRYGPRRVALAALSLSGICCILLPLMMAAGQILFLVFMLCWGMVVIADSPLFSTLVARHAPVSSKGTALTIVNCIGFSITIISIQALGSMVAWSSSYVVYTMLALGPALGLLGLHKTRQGAASR